MDSEIEDYDYCQDVEELITFLQKYTNDKEHSVRLSAILGILLITAVEPKCSDKLITYLKSLLINEDEYIRGTAALSMGVIGAQLEDPIPFLDMLKLLLFDETRFVRWHASVGLAFISSFATSREQRIKLIEDLLSSGYWYFRIGGALGMGFFCDQEGITAVIKKLKPMLNDADVDVRISTVYGLGFIAKKFDHSKELIPFFKSCLLDYDLAVNFSAKVILNLLRLS